VASAATGQPLIMVARLEIIPTGNLGNQMFQLMLAEALRQRCTGLEIGGLKLPDWQVQRELMQPLGARRLRLIGQHLDLPCLVGLIQHGFIRELEVAALGFRMSHYLPRTHNAALFPRPPGLAHTPLPELQDSLLINVRGAEILGDVHEDYGPIPLAFYRQLIAQTGQRPIFMGQLGDDAYSQALRGAFPQALFLTSRGAMGDFDLIRSARHVVVSVSSFSWLAAWFSHAQTVHLPVLGMFNPAQRPDIDLLPQGDPRYRFYRFEVRRWRGSDVQRRALLEEAVFDELEATDVAQLLRDANQHLSPARALYRLRLVTRALLFRVFGLPGRVGLRPPEAASPDLA
jgi:hypothetical protein